MYELEILFEDTAFVVNFIFSLILLIIFLRMAWNIGQIRQHLTSNPAILLKQKAEKHEFKGENEKAIDTYFDLIFSEINRTDKTIADIEREVENIQQKIKALGGVIPEKVQEVIKKNIG
jgi:hypothetical protein